MGLDELPTTGPTDDLSSIAWVHEELRRSLEAAHKSLRRFLKDAEAVTGSDIDSVDPGVLRTARSQIHQGVGALELVGLPAAAIVLRASETAIQRSIAKPQSLTPELVADVEHASFGLLDYLSRLLAGKQVSSLSLFPAYRAVQEAVEAERVHPADLWALDWRWREVASDPDVSPAPGRRDRPRRVRRPSPVADARHASAHRHRQDERDLRRPRRRLRASAGAHLLEPRRGDVRGAAPRPARLRRLHQARRLAPAGAVPPAAEGRLRRLRATRPRHSLLLRPGRAGWTRRSRAAPGRGARSLRLRRSGADRLLAAASSAASIRPSSPTPRSASPPPRKPGRRRPAARCTAWAAWPSSSRSSATRCGVCSRSASRSPPSCRPRSCRRSSRRRHRRRRWRWRSRPACSISRPRSTTATSTSPSTPNASSGSASGCRWCARSSRPSRSSRGWRSCTGASPIGRRWAASSRSCAPRSPRSRSRSTSSSAIPVITRPCTRCR